MERKICEKACFNVRCFTGFGLFFVSLCSYKKYIEYSADYKKLPLKNLMILLLSKSYFPCLLGEETDIHSK